MNVVVAVPPSIASGIDLPDLVVWKGLDAPPREGISFWVPPYVVGRDPEDIRDTMSRLPGLKVVQLLTAGVEPWPGLVPDGVTLCAGKTIHGGSTAELAVAMVLSLVRDLPLYAEQQARNDWSRHHPDTVAGRHVLVLGGGDIGAQVATTLRSLDAEVTVVTRSGDITLADVPALLPTTDVLVVALPLTDATRGLVGAEWLAALPGRAIVVNVARGPIVDLDALTEETTAGRLRAGLDVTDPEPLPADHPLWSTKGVIITPHVGGGATGWERRAQALVGAQVARFAGGEPLRYVVQHGY